MPVSKITIDNLEQISGSYAHFAAIKAWVEIVESGHGSGESLSISWDDRATIALKDGKIVGLIVWRYMKWTREAFISNGWVDKSHRHQGIYKRMYTVTKKQAKFLGALRISGGVATSNKAIRNVSKKLGRREHAIVVMQDI